MRKNQPIDEGFQLLISLAEIHVPRMWVEQLPDNPESRVCWLHCCISCFLWFFLWSQFNFNSYLLLLQCLFHVGLLSLHVMHDMVITHFMICLYQNGLDNKMLDDVNELDSGVDVVCCHTTRYLMLHNVLWTFSFWSSVSYALLFVKRGCLSCTNKC